MAMSDVEILRALKDGGISISPYDEQMLQPASYDLKVGKVAATVPSNDDTKDPRVDLEEKGVLLIPPYAPAVVYTHEEISLSTEFVGHFGIKSKLARRGLNASVGIQIDPGFKGPLSVNLINMTPFPQMLGYKDDFLTLEIDRLSVPASRGYDGEYQGRRSFTSQQLESVLGFQGHALTDVVKGFDDLRDAVNSVSQMSSKLDTFMRQHQAEVQSMQKFISNMMAEMKHLVGHIVGEREETVILRALTPEEARNEILQLFATSTEPLFYSDIAEKLRMDLEQVLEITTQMEKEGLISGMGH